MNETEFDGAAWLNPLSTAQRTLIRKLVADGRDEGFASGVEKANRALRMNKWLIPLAAFGVPAGMLIQRYLIVLG